MPSTPTPAPATFDVEEAKAVLNRRPPRYSETVVGRMIIDMKYGSWMHVNDFDCLARLLAAAVGEVERLRAALAKYADPNMWEELTGHDESGCGECHFVRDDMKNGYDIARNALDGGAA